MLNLVVEHDHVYAHSTLMEGCNADVTPDDFHVLLEDVFGSTLETPTRVIKEGTHIMVWAAYDATTGRSLTERLWGYRASLFLARKVRGHRR